MLAFGRRDASMLMPPTRIRGGFVEPAHRAIRRDGEGQAPAANGDLRTQYSTGPPRPGIALGLSVVVPFIQVCGLRAGARF
jgi:hypothetical protein